MMHFLQPKESGISIMDPLLTTKSTNVAILLGRVLLKQYSTQEDIKKITFDDLLGWALWPTLITMLCENFTVIYIFAANDIICDCLRAAY